jgi:hypothetical protein
VNSPILSSKTNSASLIKVQKAAEDLMNSKLITRAWGRMVIGFGFAAVQMTSSAAPITTSGTGADAAALQAIVDTFRASLGNPNNGNAPGPLASGRREINWDGGGATTAAVSGSTLTAFTNTRGATFTTPGTNFLQTPLDAPEFTSVNATYQTNFEFFSPVRIFTPLGSNILDVIFSLPGTAGAVPATVGGFGAIFSDVDTANTTRLEFFDIGGGSLGLFSAPVLNNGLSFLGVTFNAGERVARVRITSGAVPLGLADSPTNDVVVMDDFFYSEPVAIPEPTSMALLGSGLILFATALRRVRR